MADAHSPLSGRRLVRRASTPPMRMIATTVLTRDCLRCVALPDGLACAPSVRTRRLVRQASVSAW